MATIPRLESASLLAQPSRLPRTQPSLGLAQGLGSVAEGTQGLAAGVEQRDNARDIAFTAQQTATDQLALHQTLLDAIEAAPPDGSGVNATIQQALAQRQQDALKAAPSDAARAMVAQSYAQLRVDFGVKAQTFEAQKRGEYTVSQLDNAVGLEAAHLALNPDDFDAAKARTDQTTLALAHQTNMNPAALSLYRQKAYSDLAEAKISADIVRDPVGALNELYSGKYDQYFARDPQRLTTLVNAGVSHYLQVQNSAAREQRRQRSDQADSALKTAFDLSKAGQLDDRALKALEPILHAHDYGHLLELAAKGPIADDKTTYDNLRSRASTTDIQSEILTAATKGLLTQKSADRLYSINEKARPPGIYKTGSMFIERNFGVSDPLAILSLDPASKAAMGDALAEWDDWWAQYGEKASDTEKQRRYRDIASTYSGQAAQSRMNELATPRYPIGKRGAYEIDAMEARLEQAVKAGEISQEDRDAQQPLLDHWREAQDAVKKAEGGQ